MVKEKPRQSRRLIQGCNGNNPNIAQETAIVKLGYSGKIPDAAIKEVMAEAQGVFTGSVGLKLCVRDGLLFRFETRAYLCTYASGGFSGHIFPVNPFKLLESKVTGLVHGCVEIILTISEGNFTDCSANVDRSFLTKEFLEDYSGRCL